MKFKNIIFCFSLLVTGVFADKNLQSVRGSIRDISGLSLAKNKDGFTIKLPAKLTKNVKKLDGVIKDIRSVFYINYHTIYKLKSDFLSNKYNKQSDKYFKFIDFVPQSDLLKNAKLSDLSKDIQIIPTKARYYLYSPYASHLIGYARFDKESLDYKGMNGIEKKYNDILNAGINIRLSLDMHLQEDIANIVGNNAGVVIVMDANDGSILSGVSLPNHDTNSFSRGITYKQWNEISNNPYKPFTNRIVNGLYIPSTLATFGSSLALLESQEIEENRKIHIYKKDHRTTRKYKCDKDYVDRDIDLKDAIKGDCYQYFLDVDNKISMKDLNSTFLKLGLGKKTNIDLPNEFNGQIVKKPYKDLSKFLAMVGYGDFFVTPIQIAKYTASIATGKSLTPHLIDSIGYKKTTFLSKNVLNDFEKSKLPFFRSIFEEFGKDIKLKKPNLSVAMKISKIEVNKTLSKNEKSYTKHFLRPHFILTSYTPTDKPKYIVTILLEHAQDRSTIKNIATKVYNKLIEYGYFNKEPK